LGRFEFSDFKSPLTFYLVAALCFAPIIEIFRDFPHFDTASLVLLEMSVTLHTDLGDIKIELYCKEVEKASYNFMALCASGYYDDTLIHRNIKGFMVQMGDPTGTGKGGTSLAIDLS